MMEILKLMAYFPEFRIKVINDLKPALPLTPLEASDKYGVSLSRIYVGSA